MEVLIRACAIAALASACYAPEVRDCAVTCSAAASCAAGEVCGADGFCAAPGEAGHCGHNDAGLVPLHITIGGHGHVVLDGTSTCTSDDPQNGNCTFMVVAHAQATLIATSTDQSHPFMAWTGMACVGIAPQCAITPVAAVTVGAVFK